MKKTNKSEIKKTVTKSLTQVLKDLSIEHPSGKVRKAVSRFAKTLKKELKSNLKKTKKATAKSNKQSSAKQSALVAA